MKRLFILILLIISMTLSYFTYISYYSLDVTYYEVSDSKIKEDIDIVMISDVHDYHCKVKDKVIDKIKELDPDMILCVGDIVDNTSENEDSTLQFLKSLTEIASVYMSIGNHELEYTNSNQLISEIEKLDIKVLDKDYIDIGSIRLGGLYDYAFSTYDGTIEHCDKDVYNYLKEYTSTSKYTIMMSHRPDSFIFAYAYQWNIDMILSGHYHGGQVILPFIGGLYAPELGFFPKICYGKYDFHDSLLIVSRGLASSNELLPRFNNPPEIVNISLKGSENNG